MIENIRTVSYFCQELIVTKQTVKVEPMVTINNKQVFSDRLNAILDLAHIPEKGKGRQGSLAKIFNVSDKGARKWIEGESIPSLERLIDIVKVFKNTGVTIEWLLTGNDLFHPDIIKAENLLKKPNKHYTEQQITQDSQNQINTTQKPKDPYANVDLSSLMSAATPRSHAILENLAQAFHDKKLTEADLEILNTISQRFMKN